MTEATVVETDFVPEILPPNLPDEACETDIATIPLVSEPHLRDWQPEIPQDYLQLSGDELRERIRAARAELDERPLILVHHSPRDDIIEFADFRGDSFKLAQQAAENSEADYIVFCGVHFMAESADILTTPQQTVVLPNLAAGCSMADMAQPEDVYDAWADLGEVVDTDRVIPITYMNSAASLKSFVGKSGGAVCTSSNATAVLEWAFEQGDQVLFFPDQHLGRNTGKRLGIDPKTQTAVWSPRKVNGGLTEDRIEQSKILLWQGHCSVHIRFRVDQIERARQEHPGVRVVVHPECTQQVVDAADADGSTEFIINYVRNGPAGVYAVGTEINIVHRLNEEVAHEGKTAFCLDPVVCPCATMYRIHPAYLAWVTEALVAGRVVNPIAVDDDTRKWARVALDRMLAIT
ncbi:MAG: quinolinate synthase NadA [Chloroflexi bacterium]|nr:quinolinate synthase NadA [Chloroflexota bacterium]